MTVQSPSGAMDAKMTVVQAGSAIKGTLDSTMGVIDYAGSVSGNQIKFAYSVEKFGAPAGTMFDYAGTVTAGSMTGIAKFSSFGEGSWSARRP